MASSSCLLFLDFDGVICDSMDECMVTGWNSFVAVRGSGARIETVADADPAMATFFFAHRWMVAPPEHYYVLLRAFEEGRTLRGRGEFEQAAAEYAEALSAYRDAFFEERASRKESRWGEWISQNRIYPSVARRLNGVVDRFDVSIVTTKDDRSVREILEANGLRVPRLFGAARLEGMGSKERVISGWCSESGVDPEQAVFLDDNEAHLRPVATIGVRCRQARWGYIDPLQAPSFKGYDDFEDFLVGEEFGSPEPPYPRSGAK